MDFAAAGRLQFFQNKRLRLREGEQLFDPRVQRRVRFKPQTEAERQASLKALDEKLEEILTQDIVK